MGTGMLPSFHDAYLQILDQLETLKRVHILQTRSPEPARLFLEAGHQSDQVRNSWAVTETPDAHNLVNVSRVVVDLGRVERQGGDGAFGETGGCERHRRDGSATDLMVVENQGCGNAGNDTATSERDGREHLVRGIGGVANGAAARCERRMKESHTNRDNIEERETPSRDVEFKHKEKGLAPSLTRHSNLKRGRKEKMYGRLKEANEGSFEEQRFWKEEEGREGDEGKKQRKSEGAVSVSGGENRKEVEWGEKDDEARQRSDGASKDEYQDEAVGSEDEDSEDEDDPLLDASKTNVPTGSERETASRSDKDFRNSVRLELKNETVKREARREVYKELKTVLGGYVPLEDGAFGDVRKSFIHQIGKFVRDQVDVLQREQNRSDALKDALTREHKMNERLHSEKVALQTKLDAILSTFQQGSLRCEHCQSLFEKYSTKRREVSVAPLKRHKVVSLSPEVGEEVAAEVMRSLSMTQNHQSADDSSTDEKAGAAYGKLLRHSRGNRLIKPIQPNGPRFEGALHVPVTTEKLALVGNLLKRKRGPEVCDPIEEGKEVVEKSKRLSDVEKELVERNGALSQVEVRRSSRLSQVVRGVRRRKPSAPQDLDESPVHSTNDCDGSDEEDAEVADRGSKQAAQRQKMPDTRAELVGLKDDGDSSGDRGGTESENDTEGEASENESENDSERKGTQNDSECEEGADKHKDLSPMKWEANSQEEPEDKLLESTVDWRVNGHSGEPEEDQEQQDEEDVDGYTEELGVGKYTEFDCGVTSRLGDEITGVLRVYESGVFKVFCHCSVAGCAKGAAMTPGAFERHGGRAASRKWKESIWVKKNGQKLPIARVKELDAYLQTPRKYQVKKMQVSAFEPVEGNRTHRDEFMRCVKCNKQRRFRCRSSKECRQYHEAARNPKWECADSPDDKYTSCGEDEEREVRRMQRGALAVGLARAVCSVSALVAIVAGLLTVIALLALSFCLFLHELTDGERRQN